MTARELIYILETSGFDLDTPVYVRGYEGGHDDIRHVTLGYVERDTGGAYCGEHTWRTLTDAEKHAEFAVEYDEPIPVHEQGILLSYNTPFSLFS